MPCWQRRAVRFSHAGLYALMLALPLSGWLFASAAPEQDLLSIENRVFGAFALPDPFVPGSVPVASAAGAIHAVAAALLAALIVVHAGAAIWHQFVARDGVLARITFGT
jgi:cytochrome b561